MTDEKLQYLSQYAQKGFHSSVHKSVHYGGFYQSCQEQRQMWTVCDQTITFPTG